MLKLRIALFLTFSAILAYGQLGNHVLKMNKAQADEAWSAVISLPDSLPPISGGGLVVEPEVNGSGRMVWLLATKPGSYLFSARTCNGNEMKLGEIYIDQQNSGMGLSYPIIDTAKLGMAAPFLHQLCQVDAIRLFSGSLERSFVDIGWRPEPPPTTMVVSEAMSYGSGTPGQYVIAVSGFVPSLGSTVILGRYSIGQVRGSTITFVGDQGAAGLTTLTICSSSGECITSVYSRRRGPSGGKG